MKAIFLSLAACLTFVAFAVQAQNDFATWSLQSRIGSASRLNPAFRQVNKVQIGLPLLSSYEFGMGNTGFTLQEVSHFEGDTFYFDPKKLPDALSDRNFFYVNQNIGLLSVCINRPVYSMEIFSNLRTQFVFEYPGDLFRLAIEGNAAHLNETLAFGSIGFNFYNYNETGIRVARQFGKVTVGIAPKLLTGLQNVKTVRNEVSLHTDETTFDLEGNVDFLIHTAGFFDSTFSTGVNGDKALQEMKRFRNLGVGLDLGFVYDHSEKWSFAASVKDIGRIKWKSMVRSFSSEGNYTFSGVDLFNFIEQTDTLDGFDEYIDSLGSAFTVTEFSESYTTWIPAKFYAGATYKLREKTHAGAMVSAEWNAQRFVPAVGLSLTQFVGRKLAATVTYSYYNRDWFNVGFGFIAGAGPFELFVTSDNVLGALNYLKFRNTHVHAGIQLAFGRFKSNTTRKTQAE